LPRVAGGAGAALAPRSREADALVFEGGVFARGCGLALLCFCVFAIGLIMYGPR
jgi:hypothetical protein